MNTDLSALFRTVITVLNDEVRPKVSDEQVRIQLAAVVDILGKLQGMTAWAPDAMQQQAQALQAGCQSFEALATQAGLTLPAPVVCNADELGRVEQRLVQLTDWLFAHKDMDESLRTELDMLLCDAMRQQLLAERKRIPLTDFASMSAGGKAVTDSKKD